MDSYLDRIRIKCLVMVCKTFGEKVKFSQIGENIGEDQDILELLARGEGAKIDGEYLMLKDSLEPLRNSQILDVKKLGGR